MDPTKRLTHDDLSLVGEIADGLLAVLTDLDSSLADILSRLSKSMHIMFTVCRSRGTDFIPGQLCNDCQAAAKDLFLGVARRQVFAKKEGKEDAMKDCLHQHGTNSQESMFRTVQTMTHDRSVDMVRLGQHPSAAAPVTSTHKSHPDWDKGLRRLKASKDHINPASTKGSRLCCPR